MSDIRQRCRILVCLLLLCVTAGFADSPQAQVTVVVKGFWRGALAFRIVRVERLDSSGSSPVALTAGNQVFQAPQEIALKAGGRYKISFETSWGIRGSAEAAIEDSHQLVLIPIQDLLADAMPPSVLDLLTTIVVPEPCSNEYSGLSQWIEIRWRHDPDRVQRRVPVRNCRISPGLLPGYYEVEYFVEGVLRGAGQMQGLKREMDLRAIDWPKKGLR